MSFVDSLKFNAFLLFQKTSISKNSLELVIEKEKTDFSRIRCPLCEWQPQASDRWMCADAGHPECFYAACYTSWNTFETNGRCPGCNHQWRWTTCLSCYQSSLHEDWYLDNSNH